MNYSQKEARILINYHRQRMQFYEQRLWWPSEALALSDLESYLKSLPEDPAHVSPWETHRDATKWWERRTEGHEIRQDAYTAGFDLVD